MKLSPTAATLWLVTLIVAFVYALLVFPGRYYFTVADVSGSGVNYTIRVDRISGRADFLMADGWIEIAADGSARAARARAR